jgi:hypothetical protein
MPAQCPPVSGAAARVSHPARHASVRAVQRRNSFMAASTRQPNTPSTSRDVFDAAFRRSRLGRAAQPVTLAADRIVSGLVAEKRVGCARHHHGGSLFARALVRIPGPYPVLRSLVLARARAEYREIRKPPNRDLRFSGRVVARGRWARCSPRFHWRSRRGLRPHSPLYRERACLNTGRR